MTFRCYTPHKVNKMCCSRKRDIKMKNNAVQKKHNIRSILFIKVLRTHISSPAILKTVHLEESNSNTCITVSINHNGAMHSAKLSVHYPWFNLICKTKKKYIPEILLDIILYNSYISLWSMKSPILLSGAYATLYMRDGSHCKMRKNKRLLSYKFP